RPRAASLRSQRSPDEGGPAFLIAMVVEGRSEKLGSASSPFVVESLDVGDPEVKKGVESLRIIVDIEDDVWLVWRPTTTAVDDDPDVGELHIGGHARADRGPVKNDLTAEDVAVEARGFRCPVPRRSG